jgi:hypothetical protein
MKAIKEIKQYPVYDSVLWSIYSIKQPPKAVPDTYIDVIEYRCPYCTALLAHDIFYGWHCLSCGREDIELPDG